MKNESAANGVVRRDENCRYDKNSLNDSPADVVKFFDAMRGERTRTRQGRAWSTTKMLIAVRAINSS
ncbi:unnamed protein product [Dracunculus medinensis]|uniref:Recombinase domain-containing protein n=1 Tax=Dracunculus medinensis TaxID=318479 RepID=A0A0N4U9G6_DRAME|nr:unnamed protein product [Dracunculus medinensis]